MTSPTRHAPPPCAVHRAGPPPDGPPVIPVHPSAAAAVTGPAAGAVLVPDAQEARP